MNPTHKCGGLQLGASCCNRLHDRSPRDIDRGIDVSVHRESARLTDEGGLTLAVLFCRVATSRTSTACIARVYRVQWHASKSSLVGKERTELSKSPGTVAIALRTSNRAIGAFPNVPEFFNRYALPVGFGLLNNPFGDHLVSIVLEPGFFAREFLEMPLRGLCSTFL